MLRPEDNVFSCLSFFERSIPTKKQLLNVTKFVITVLAVCMIAVI